MSETTLEGIDIALMMDRLRPSAKWRRSESYEALKNTWGDETKIPTEQEIADEWQTYLVEKAEREVYDRREALIQKRMEKNAYDEAEQQLIIEGKIDGV